MLKKINGTWLEIHHYGLPEGKYFNPMVHEFTPAQWKAKVKEIASLKMKYIVLIGIALTEPDKEESFFPSSIYKRSKMIRAKEPIKAILEEAEKQNMKVFIGTGCYGYWMKPWENMTSDKIHQKTFKAMEEIYNLYGRYKSFYGWYFPDETGITKYFEPEYIEYVNKFSRESRKINPELKTLIAPYGTNKVVCDDYYVEQLKQLDVDFVAYQDEVGVKKSTPEETKQFYENLKKAHDKANRSKLWADVETFDFEGDVYKSALLPAPIKRLEKQLESVSESVDEILVFEYQGMMSKPGSIAFCGHPASIKYYRDYKKLLRKIEKQK